MPIPKQDRLITQFTNYLRKRFPEVEVIDVVPSPENPKDLWMYVTAPGNEDREIELSEYAAKKTIQLLLKYGCHILVLQIDKPIATTESH